MLTFVSECESADDCDCPRPRGASITTRGGRETTVSTDTTGATDTTGISWVTVETVTLGATETLTFGTAAGDGAVAGDGAAAGAGGAGVAAGGACSCADCDGVELTFSIRGRNAAVRQTTGTADNTSAATTDFFICMVTLPFHPRMRSTLFS